MKNLAQGYLALWEQGELHNWPAHQVPRFLLQEKTLRAALHIKTQMAHPPNYYTDGHTCPKCSYPTITETKRDWWCTNPPCPLSKKKKDIRKSDKYRPNPPSTKIKTCAS